MTISIDLRGTILGYMYDGLYCVNMLLYIVVINASNPIIINVTIAFNINNIYIDVGILLNLYILPTHLLLFCFISGSVVSNLMYISLISIM